MLDEVVVTVDNYFSSAVEKSFKGTATELAELIKESDGTEIAPPILSKRLLKFHSQFCSLGYSCEFGRTNQGRFIKIEKLGDGSADRRFGLNKPFFDKTQYHFTGVKR